MPTAFHVALAIGLISGLKHAFEPDHIIAVSTLLHQERRLLPALRTGLAWGAGHTTTLFLGIIVLSLLHVDASAPWLPYMEAPVAVMLLGIGGWAAYGAIRGLTQLHRHEHDGIEHYHVGDHPHPHPFVRPRTGWRGYQIGLVHGMAGSGALMLLVAATLPTLTAGLVYALVFGFGSIVGMGIVTTLLSFPFLATRTRPVLHHGLTIVSGTLSIALGAFILQGFFR